MATTFESTPEILKAWESLSDENCDIYQQKEALSYIENIGVKALGPSPAEIEEEWKEITLHDGWLSKTLVFRPKETSRPRPLIVAFHGGGFSLGDPISVYRPARDWALAHGAVVVCPSYKLAPEHLFPSAMQSAWEILVYLSKVAENDFGVKLDGPDGGFIVSGFSAGGTITSVVLGINVFGLRGKEYEMLAKPLTGAFINCPLLANKNSIPSKYKHLWKSREENAVSEGISSAGIDRFMEFFKPDYQSPWFSPFNAIEQDDNRQQSAAACPRVYIQVGHFDPLRDDGIVLGRVLSDLGIEVKEDYFSQDGHVAWTSAAVGLKTPGIPEATLSNMGWLLGR